MSDDGFLPGLFIGGVLIFICTLVDSCARNTMPEKEFQRQAVQDGVGKFSANADGSVYFEWLTNTKETKGE